MATAVRPSKPTNFFKIFYRCRLLLALRKVRKCELCSREVKGFHDHDDLCKIIASMSPKVSHKDYRILHENGM
jgi:hypothetical protein